MTSVDFLIVGQGIAGTIFSYVALQAGHSIHVVDFPRKGQASKVAGGLINPITGRFMKKSWMIDQLMPDVVAIYRSLDEWLGIQSFKQIPIQRLLTNTEDINDWELKCAEQSFAGYIDHPRILTDERIQPHPAAGSILQGAWLDTALLLDTFREYLKTDQLITEENFDYQDVHPGSWKDISFKYIVFCEGIFGQSNPFFPDIPFRPAKGEVMIAELPGDDFSFVLNKNMLLIPLGNHKYKVGATLVQSDVAEISEQGLSELKQKLESVVTCPYTIHQQEVGIRPTVKDRRPLLGQSLSQETAYIFNGLGTKGVSLAPFFARQLLLHITTKAPLLPEVNWRRFIKNQAS